MAALESVHRDVDRVKPRHDLYAQQHHLATDSRADIHTHYGYPDRIFWTWCE